MKSHRCAKHSSACSPLFSSMFPRYDSHGRRLPRLTVRATRSLCTRIYGCSSCTAAVACHTLPYQFVEIVWNFSKSSSGVFPITYRNTCRRYLLHWRSSLSHKSLFAAQILPNFVTVLRDRNDAMSRETGNMATDELAPPRNTARKGPVPFWLRVGGTRTCARVSVRWHC